MLRVSDGSFSSVTDSLRSADLSREGYQCKSEVISLQVHFVLHHERTKWTYYKARAYYKASSAIWHFASHSGIHEIVEVPSIAELAKK